MKSLRNIWYRVSLFLFGYVWVRCEDFTDDEILENVELANGKANRAD